MQRDSITNTIVVATLLCIVCSVLVSSAAVVLNGFQEANKLEERKRNILKAAGLYDPDTDPDADLETLFERVETRVVDLETGELVSESEIDPQEYDPREAARDPERSVKLDPGEDIAGIKRRPKYELVYLVKKGGKLDQVVLPIQGKGLWSTLYGYLALDADMETIRGITFYEHGETPGLGGEIDNEKWQEQWEGKQAFGPQGQPQIEVAKGTVDKERPEAKYQVDGLAGATITARGVTNLVQFWLGEQGFRDFLENLEKQRAA
jgi:Na+-transporting NADH:ubiquinone oxidoreductase subunit C